MNEESRIISKTPFFPLQYDEVVDANTKAVKLERKGLGFTWVWKVDLSRPLELGDTDGLVGVVKGAVPEKWLMQTDRKPVPEIDPRAAYDPASPYYGVGGIEALDAVKAKLTTEQYDGFLLGSALKYLLRANWKKNMARDVEKAKFFVDRLNREVHGD